MAGDALQPLGVHHPRAKDPVDLLPEVPHPRAVRVLGVAEVVLGLFPRKRADGRDEPAVELEVIVAVQDVVLPVVLVVQGDLGALQPPTEDIAGVHALGVGRVGVAAPVDVDLRDVRVAFPVALLDQGQDARAVRARL